LLSHVENNTSDQADGVLTVPTRSYTDPERWANEVELIFMRLPLMLALSIELRTPATTRRWRWWGGRPPHTREGRQGAGVSECLQPPRRARAEPGKGNCNRSAALITAGRMPMTAG